MPTLFSLEVNRGGGFRPLLERRILPFQGLPPAKKDLFVLISPPNVKPEERQSLLLEHTDSGFKWTHRIGHEIQTAPLEIAKAIMTARDGKNKLEALTVNGDTFRLTWAMLEENPTQIANPTRLSIRREPLMKETQGGGERMEKVTA